MSHTNNARIASIGSWVKVQEHGLDEVEVFHLAPVTNAQRKSNLTGQRDGAGSDWRPAWGRGNRARAFRPDQVLDSRCRAEFEGVTNGSSDVSQRDEMRSFDGHTPAIQTGVTRES